MTAKIGRMYRKGFSILQIYHEFEGRRSLEKIADEIIKSEMTFVTEHFESVEKYIIVPSKMNYSFKTVNNEDKI